MELHSRILPFTMNHSGCLGNRSGKKTFRASLILLLCFSLNALPIDVAAEKSPSRGKVSNVTTTKGTDKSDQQMSCALVEGALKIASRIRKLGVMKKVPCKIQGKDAVERYLREAITRDVPKEKIETEGKVFTVLGLIPRSFDYYNGLVKLYTEQLAGYYEPDGQFYAMADWIPARYQMGIAVHELTHALQDQHFNLNNFTDETRLSNDELLARTAVVEGDAMGVMLDHERARHRIPLLEQLDSVDAILASELVSASTVSGTGAPSPLENMMMFPYLSGLRFVHTLLKRGGHASVDSAFLLPPESTEQVLHPELFFHRSENPGFERIEGEENPIENFRNEQPRFRDVMGEFTISLILSQWIGPARASQAASGWGGDRVRYFRKEESGEWLLHWQTRWDSEKDAEEFYQGLADGYEKRFQTSGLSPRLVLVQEGKQREFRESEVGDIQMKIEKRDVNIIIHGQSF